MDRDISDVVIVPVSSREHLAGLLKRFQELVALSLAVKLPRLVGVQVAGCAPIATAFERREGAITPWAEANTVA